MHTLVPGMPWGKTKTTDGTFADSSAGYSSRVWGARLPRQPLRTYFFFLAEDGIRDLYVTGVQTCALPICESIDKTGQVILAGRFYREDLRNVVKDRKSTRLNSSHVEISYAVFCLKKK